MSVSRAQTSLTAEDRADIQALTASYASRLFGCDAAGFADLFVPETGYFASGFRGVMVGREKLIALVESERHCAPGAEPRAGGQGGPTIEIEMTAGGVTGVADLGTAEYQDEYVKTPDGWRFRSRTVVIAVEKAAGLDAAAMLAINRSAGEDLGDNYEAEANGAGRLLTSGVQINVTDGEITGRAYLKRGGYNEQVYEEVGNGEWRVRSSRYVAP